MLSRCIGLVESAIESGVYEMKKKVNSEWKAHKVINRVCISVFVMILVKLTCSGVSDYHCEKENTLRLLQRTISLLSGLPVAAS